MFSAKHTCSNVLTGKVWIKINGMRTRKLKEKRENKRYNNKQRYSDDGVMTVVVIMTNLGYSWVFSSSFWWLDQVSSLTSFPLSSHSPLCLYILFPSSSLFDLLTIRMYAGQGRTKFGVCLAGSIIAGPSMAVFMCLPSKLAASVCLSPIFPAFVLFFFASLRFVSLSFRLYFVAVVYGQRANNSNNHWISCRGIRCIFEL